MDGTRELMRHDLELWPSEFGGVRSPEAYASKVAPAEARFIGRALR